MADEDLNSDDIIEIIELDDNLNEDVAANMDDMDLEGVDIDNEEMDSNEIEGETNANDDADGVFRKHKGSVFCVRTDPSSSHLAVSGGEDDMAYVWKITDGGIVLECKGHTDSVTACSFSHDSVYAATADMSGLIKVWKMGTKEEVTTLECGDLEWMEWHGQAHVLLAGTHNGDIYMWKIPSEDSKVFLGQGASCTAGRMLPDGKRLCCAYEDGSIRIWDLKSGNNIHHLTGGIAHSDSVTCTDVYQDNVLVVTGSTDCTSKLINSNTGKVLTTFNCLPSDNPVEENSVEAVGFSNVQSVCATGTLAGDLVIWDIPKQMSRQTCKHEAGISKLRWDTGSPLLYTSTLDGIVTLWDSRSGVKESQWVGHEAEILDFDITRDGSHLVTSSGDMTCRVFSLR